jgi:hypothetical protein
MKRWHYAIIVLAAIYLSAGAFLAYEAGDQLNWIGRAITVLAWPYVLWVASRIH